MLPMNLIPTDLPCALSICRLGFFFARAIVGPAASVYGDGSEHPHRTSTSSYVRTGV